MVDIGSFEISDANVDLVREGFDDGERRGEVVVGQEMVDFNRGDGGEEVERGRERFGFGEHLGGGGRP